MPPTDTPPSTPPSDFELPDLSPDDERKRRFDTVAEDELTGTGILSVEELTDTSSTFDFDDQFEL